MKTVVLAGVLALTSCATVNPAIPPSAEARLLEICRTEPLLHAAFLALSPQVSPRAVAAEADAHRIVRAVCANPPTDAATALAAVLTATAAIVAATAEAKGS